MNVEYADIHALNFSAICEATTLRGLTIP